MPGQCTNELIAELTACQGPEQYQDRQNDISGGRGVDAFTQ